MVFPDQLDQEGSQVLRVMLDRLVRVVLQVQQAAEEEPVSQDLLEHLVAQEVKDLQVLRGLLDLQVHLVLLDPLEMSVLMGQKVRVVTQVRLVSQVNLVLQAHQVRSSIAILNLLH